MSVPALDSSSNSLDSSLDVFIHKIQGELDELILRKANIRRRMRNLRRQLNNATTSENADQVATRADARRKRHASLKSNRANSRTAQRLNLRLRRACRIALMELDGDATPEKIYSSIVRRGSFSFVNLGVDPIAVITRTLEIVATENVELDNLASASD